jgi:hypothetical protein
MPERSGLPWRDEVNGDEYLYRIDRWDSPRGSRIEEEKVVSNDLYAARAAFAVLVQRYPDQAWTLRQRAHVIAQHPPRPPSPPREENHDADPEYSSRVSRGRRRRFR